MPKQETTLSKVIDMKAPSEKHLEDWIVANKVNFKPEPVVYQGVILGKKKYENGYLHNITMRQPILSCGRPDIIGFNGNDIVVVELKKDSVDEKTIMQLNRYIIELEQIALFLETELIEGFLRKPTVNISRYIKGIAVGFGKPKRKVMWSIPHNIEVVSYDYDGSTYMFNDCYRADAYNWYNRNSIVEGVGSHTSVLKIMSSIVRTAHAIADEEGVA